MMDQQSISGFLEQLASATPAPGGGSASAIAGAMGAALVSMVARLTKDHEKYASCRSQMEEALSFAEASRARLVSLAADDAAAFEGVTAAYRQPYTTWADKVSRQRAIQEALKKATEVPLEVMDVCCGLLHYVSIVAESGNPNALSDAAVGAILCLAGVEGAFLNVSVNLQAINDGEYFSSVLDKATDLKRRARKMAAGVQALVDNRLSV